MIAKRFVLVIALLTLVVSPLVFSSVAVAQSDASAAAEFVARRRGGVPRRTRIRDHPRRVCQLPQGPLQPRGQ